MTDLSIFADPSLLHNGDVPPITHNTPTSPFSANNHAFNQIPTQYFQPPSPAASEVSSQGSHGTGSARIRSGPNSPYLHTSSFQPYAAAAEARRFSIASSHSRKSVESPRSNSLDEEGRERRRCPRPDCGRPFKDLKAHMLTHQSERPEKCPITSCAYHQKGFARKYDKSRHTLTHYKGNMVCGFCPGSGSAAEKSFNRADVFKRHLKSLHSVEQNPPNSRKKSPSSASNKKTTTLATNVSGKCSTCSATFENAQDFYEHLDDCVLRVVQQEVPSEAINETLLRGVANDKAVLQTLERHMLATKYDIDDHNDAAFDEVDDQENPDDVDDEVLEDRPKRLATVNNHPGKGEILSKSKGESY